MYYDYLKIECINYQGYIICYYVNLKIMENRPKSLLVICYQFKIRIRSSSIKVLSSVNNIMLFRTTECLHKLLTVKINMYFMLIFCAAN